MAAIHQCLFVMLLVIVGFSRALPLNEDVDEIDNEVIKLSPVENHNTLSDEEDLESVVIEAEKNVPEEVTLSPEEIYKEKSDDEDLESVVIEAEKNVPEETTLSPEEIYKMSDEMDLESVAVDAAEGDRPPEEDHEEWKNYFSEVSTMMRSAIGEPNEDTGSRVDRFNASSGQNVEELGEYYQGDILFPAGLARNGLVHEPYHWPGGDVPYELDNSFNPQDLNKIEDAFKEYERRTCVRFVRHNREKNYIRLTKKNTGCWSSVGMLGGEQEVNLQSPGCTTMVGTVIHELMHAIGFMHEQNRSERDSYVTIMWHNIEANRDNNFALAAQGTVTGFGVTYDYGSVMHYSDHAFSVNGQPTIVSKVQGVKMGQRDGFSSGDVQKIRAMYKCGSPRSI